MHTKKLLEILDGLTLQGNNTQLIESTKNTIAFKLDGSCYLWEDCYRPNPLYPEYCLVKGFLTDILIQLQTKNKGNNIVIETSFDPMKLLENNFLNQTFSQIQDQINNLGDALTSELGNYFGNLADFDEQVGAADVLYAQGS